MAGVRGIYPHRPPPEGSLAISPGNYTVGKGECPNILRSVGHRIEVDTET